MYYEGQRGPTLGNRENNDGNEQNPRNNKEESKKRNITTLLNNFWHYIKYNFIDRYKNNKKESDKKTMEIVHSEKFVFEVRNFLNKLNELEKIFLSGDFNNNSLNSVDSRQEFFDEVNNEIKKFKEQNSFGITLSELHDYWEDSGLLRITAHYKEYLFLIDYTSEFGFRAINNWSL